MLHILLTLAMILVSFIGLEPSHHRRRVVNDLPASRFLDRKPNKMMFKLWAREHTAPDQFECLDKLWTKESHWNFKAVNHRSGAAGIPQALPAEKMGQNWQNDGYQQMKWGLKYIHRRYGNSCSAWNHSLVYGWY